ncbi:contact-dependent growth inhibition system immunity protein, partial [Salmonella enterica]
ITIRPSFHEKLEAWSGDRISETDNVVLAVDSTPAEIGAGLRLALSRCKG